MLCPSYIGLQLSTYKSSAHQIGANYFKSFVYIPLKNSDFYVVFLQKMSIGSKIGSFTSPLNLTQQPSIW